MGTRIPNILDLAAVARESPQTAIFELSQLRPAQRQAVFCDIRDHYVTQSYRPYTPNVDQAIHQLVANEFMASPAEQKKWTNFYAGASLRKRFPDRYHPAVTVEQTFAERYQEVWRWAQTEGTTRFFSQPDMLTYVAQTVRYAKTDPVPIQGSLMLVTPASTTAFPRGGTLKLGAESVAFYSCGNFVANLEGNQILTDELGWVSRQSYKLPAAVALTDTPGGYHYYNGMLCDTVKVLGHSIRAGLIYERFPCTLRHELSHVIYAQLDPAARQKIEELYLLAMTADFGLLFNDEYYMKDRKFLHAGHPMKNPSEFFAGALHAVSQHRSEVMQNMNRPDTPEAVRAYAYPMMDLISGLPRLRKQ
jgi:hypothetical protein